MELLCCITKMILRCIMENGPQTTRRFSGWMIVAAALKLNGCNQLKTLLKGKEDESSLWLNCYMASHNEQLMNTFSPFGTSGVGSAM